MRLVTASLIYVTNPGIVTGTESLLDSDVANSEVLPDDYVIYQKDRNGHNGGVFFLPTDASMNSVPINTGLS